MTLVLKLCCVWWCLFYFFVYNGNATKTSFEIQRGKYDTFQNLRCQMSQSCASDQCQSYKAECMDDKCERCKCNKDGRNTFVTSGSNAGNCTKDENVISGTGCYRFQNGSFMLYLDNETCRSHQFSVPNFSGNKNCCIKWADSEILHSSDAAWQNISHEKQLFSIQRKLNETKILMVDQEALKIFSGSLLRLVISCEVKNYSKNHCLLLKFKSLQRNTRKFRFKVRSRKQGVINNNTVILIWVSDLCLLCVAAVIGIISHKTKLRLARSKILGTENTGQNRELVPLTLNDSEPSTSNQPPQGDSAKECLCQSVNKKAFTLHQPFNDDNTFGVGSLRNYQEKSMELEITGGYVIPLNTDDTHVPLQIPQYEIPTSHQYEYPDQSQSHQYEYPSLKSTEADARGKTNACAQEGGYSPLVRPPLNTNESENGGYTSLIKDKKTTDKVGTTAKRDDTNADYTPLAIPPLKDKQREDSYYTSLIKNEKTSEKAVTKANIDDVDELLYVDAIDGDYTPLAKLKPNESEVPAYQHLVKDGQKELKKPMPPGKQKKK